MRGFFGRVSPAVLLARLSGGPRSLVVVIGVLIFALQCLAWPLQSVGPDFVTYMQYYVDFFKSAPTYPLLMLRLTPGPSLFYGGLLSFTSPAVVEGVMGLLFCVSLVAVYEIGAAWRRGAGLAAALALALSPPFGGLFHRAASDPLYACGLACFGWSISRTLRRPATWKFALLGAGIFGLTMIRPAAEALLVCAILPVWAEGLPWGARLRNMAVMLLAAAGLLTGWAGYHLVRDGEFVVARGSRAEWPLYRLLVRDRLVRSENGPASAALAEAISTDLLPREPYCSEGTTISGFLQSGDGAGWGDLLPLSDRRWGWDENYGVLRRAGWEAMCSHPRAYATAVAADLGQLLLSSRSGVPSASKTQHPSLQLHGYQWAWASARDGHFTSFEAMLSCARDPRFQLPVRDGSRPLARWWRERFSPFYPPPLFWFALGLAGWAVGRRSPPPSVCFWALLGIASTIGAVAGIYPDARYRIPFDSFFILFGVMGAVSLWERFSWAWRAEPRRA